MYKNLVLVLSTLQLALDLGLIARQITACSSTSQDHSTKSKDYSRAKLLYAVYSALHSQLLLLAAVHYNILPRLYAYCYASAVEHSLMTTQMAASLLFVLLLGLAMQLLTLPGSLYYTLVIEQHHGFNRSSLLLYLRDTLLSTLLAILIGLPLIALLLVTITYFGDSFYIYAACLFLAFTLFLNTVFPLYIQPLFNTFVPLQKGTLKTRIEHLCHELGFPLGGTSVVDGSKRSSHSNAYFYGLWSDKRIVLFDTLVQQSSVDQVVAVLAHELGHWKHSHIWKRLFGVQLHLALLFYVFSLVLKDELLFTSFGFLTRENVHLGKPDIVAFLLFQLIYSPVELLVSILLNYQSRAHEYQADAFAVSLGHAEMLKQALVKMSEKNLANQSPDAWYALVHYSHPSLNERLRAIDLEVERLLKERKVGKESKKVK